MSQGVTDGAKVSSTTICDIVAGKGTDGLAHPMQTDVYGRPLVGFATPYVDAFGRLRTGAPFCLSDHMFEYDLNPLFWDSIIVGSATVTSSALSSGFTLATTAANGDSVKFQTRMYHRYQPGRSQLVFMTGTMGAPKAGVTQRIGYYGERDGLFFEQTIAGAAVVRRTNTSGTPTDNRIPQSQWNTDKLDGTGPSGFTLDLTKTQIFVIDMEWLGVGQTRWGFQIDGVVTYCHVEYHANTTFTVPYMRTANLPLRYELTNTSATAGATTMLGICGTVLAEGGQDVQGMNFSASNGATTRAAAAGTYLPVLSIRPALTFAGIMNRVFLTVDFLRVFVDANAAVRIVLNPTLTGASFNAVDTNSTAQFDIAATVMSGGTVMYSDYAVASGPGGNAVGAVGANPNFQRRPLTLNAAGTVGDILTVGVAGVGTATPNVSAALGWMERR